MTYDVEALKSNSDDQSSGNDDARERRSRNLKSKKSLAYQVQQSLEDRVLLTMMMIIAATSNAAVRKLRKVLGSWMIGSVFQMTTEIRFFTIRDLPLYR